MSGRRYVRATNRAGCEVQSRTLVDARSRRLDEQWFHSELDEKLELVSDVLGDLLEVAPGSYEAQQGVLVALSVYAREAAVCIASRPASLRHAASEPAA